MLCLCGSATHLISFTGNMYTVFKNSACDDGSSLRLPLDFFCSMIMTSFTRGRLMAEDAVDLLRFWFWKIAVRRGRERITHTNWRPHWLATTGGAYCSAKVGKARPKGYIQRIQRQPIGAEFPPRCTINLTLWSSCSWLSVSVCWFQHVGRPFSVGHRK